MEPKIIGNIELINSKIVSKGDGNVVYINSPNKLILKDSVISFEGNNSLVFLNECKRELRVKTTLQNDCILYIGKNVSFHKSVDLHLLCAERKHIFIGNDVLFSTNIWIRTSDAHCIYSVKGNARLNNPKSVVIGDHVWLGQSTLVLKGSFIGSGSIFAAGAVAANSIYLSNSIYGGVPAKLIGEPGSVYFSRKAVNDIQEDQLKEIEKGDPDKRIFISNNDFSFQKSFMEFINSNHTIDESITYLKNLPNKKDRFAVKDGDAILSYFKSKKE